MYTFYIDEAATQQAQRNTDADLKIDQLLGQLDVKTHQIAELEQEIDRSAVMHSMVGTVITTVLTFLVATVFVEHYV